MNSELSVIMSLTALQSDIDKEIDGLSNEVNRLSGKDNLSKVETKTLKSYNKQIKYLNIKKTNIDKDIEELKNLSEDAKEAFANVLSSKYQLNLTNTSEEVVDNNTLEENSGDFENMENENNNDKKKFFTKKKVSVIAFLTAIGLGVCVYGCTRSNKNEDKQKANSNNEEIIMELIYGLDTLSINDLETIKSAIVNSSEKTDEVEGSKEENNILEESEQQEGIFTDIDDEEQVYKRASTFMEMISLNNSGNDYSVEEIENIMKWNNGGVVNEASQQEALFAVTRVESLLNKENQNEVEKPFDISMLFKDGSRGQRLASKIYDIRVRFMNAKDDTEKEKIAEEFTTLFVNSWVLNGTNNEISAYELETSFMEALIDKYFLNTYAMINVQNINVVVNGVKFNLDKVADEVNQANCPALVTADNGETFTTYVNKFSSDMIGAVTEASLIKSEGNSLVLSK